MEIFRVSFPWRPWLTLTFLGTMTDLWTPWVGGQLLIKNVSVCVAVVDLIV